MRVGRRWRDNLHKGESMFNAEQLLGKIVGEVIGGSSGSWGGGKKSMLSGLGSGSGLMTVIGLGVGAYEILKQQQEQKSQTSGMGQANVLAHGPFGDVEGGGDLLVREVGLPLQADNVFDHA